MFGILLHLIPHIVVSVFLSAIVAGNPLRGKVIVQVKKKVESCNSVTLEVLGREKTHAYKTDGGDGGGENNDDNNHGDENSSPRGKRKQRRKSKSTTTPTTNPSSSNHYHSSDDDDDYNNDHHDGKEEIQDRHAFFRVVLNLQNSGEKVNALTYEFPFEVHLPSSLPASCEYKDEDNDRGGFSIEVRAEKITFFCLAFFFHPPSADGTICLFLS